MLARRRDRSRPTAMEANGNLVAHLHDYKTRLVFAETRREDAGKTVREMRAVAETKHLPTSEQWVRMARPPSQGAGQRPRSRERVPANDLAMG